MNIRCVITDDEPIARKGLKSYIEKISFLQLAGECEDGISLNEFLKNNQVDLVFLDIEMPWLNGIELLQSLTSPPKIIFTTAYEKYAIKGYEFDVVDYLLKPFSFDRFLKAVNKAEAILKKEQKENSSGDFFIKVDGRMIRVNWEDIYVIESLENYVTIYTRDEKFITHLTLKTIISNMPSSFIQVHKSTLINSKYITGIIGNMVEAGKYKVTISRGLKNEVIDRILQNKVLKRGE